MFVSKYVTVLVLLVLTNVAFASNFYPALAVSASASGGDSPIWAWSVDVTQKIANRRALDACNKNAPKKDCALPSFRAIAKAKASTESGVSLSTESLEDAKKQAVNTCNKQGTTTCEVVTSITQPGFFSIAEIDDEKKSGDLYIYYGSNDLERAIKEAREMCEKDTNAKCRIWRSSVILGVLEFSKDKKLTPEKIKSDLPVAQKNCRPQTSTIHCSSQCYNGDCVITYENGCKMRVQVRPSFDSFSNEWKYPSPQC
jgi:hypothetical protein